MIGRDLLFSIGNAVLLPKGVTWYLLNSRSNVGLVQRDSDRRVRLLNLTPYE